MSPVNVIWVVMLWLCCPRCGSECISNKFGKKISFLNSTITELSISTESGLKSVEECSALCYREKECVSFFYNTHSGMCTAHTVQFYSTEARIADEGSVYYTMNIDKRYCADILNNDPDSPDGVYIINPEDDIGPARVYCDMSTGGSGWAVIQDCAEILSNDPDSPSGVYFINPADGVGHFRVYCDMTTDGGGWTVFQRRQDGSEDFFRNWDDYKIGFGTMAAEVWLGNDNINRLTTIRANKLRVDLGDHEGQSRFAKYSSFRVENEASNYRLTVSGYSGDAGDALWLNDEMQFTTKDRDNDLDEGNCAVNFIGAWWYSACHEACLNGKYGDNSFGRGIVWYPWRGHEYSLKWAEMKLKPI